MTTHSQIGFGNTDAQNPLSVGKNLKADFVLCSTGTEAAEGLVSRSALFHLVFLEIRKRKTQPKFVILKIPVPLLSRFVCKNLGKEGEFSSKLCFGDFLVQVMFILFLITAHWINF